MGGCASSKTAEDKDEMAAKSRNTKQNMKQNGKTKSSPNANNMSGSLSSPNTNNNNGNTNVASGQQATSGIRQNSINSNLAAANNYLNNNNNNNNPNVNNNNFNNNAGNSLIESNNLILLTEFFKAVGNGELEKLKQILFNVDEINNNSNANNNNANNNTNKKKNQNHFESNSIPQIRMTKAELLNAGMTDADGLTALSIAAGRKHKELTEFLADLPEVDVNKASESGITPLLMVAEVGWTDVMKKLLKRGAHVDAAPKGRTAEEAKIAGSTPLIGATKYNNPEAVRLLLEHKANPNHQNQSGISALMLASEQGFYDCVKNLCDGGADVELAPSGKTALSMNLSGQTPLFCAAKEGHLEIVKYLLDRHADPNATNHYGVSVLWIPCQRGLIKIVELLLQRGGNPEIAPSGPEAEERSISGWTPLYAAIKSRQYPVVKLLLNKGMIFVISAVKVLIGI